MVNSETIVSLFIVPTIYNSLSSVVKTHRLTPMSLVSLFQHGIRSQTRGNPNL